MSFTVSRSQIIRNHFDVWNGNDYIGFIAVLSGNKFKWYIHSKTKSLNGIEFEPEQALKTMEIVYKQQSFLKETKVEIVPNHVKLSNLRLLIMKFTHRNRNFAISKMKVLNGNLFIEISTNDLSENRSIHKIIRPVSLVNFDLKNYLELMTDKLIQQNKESLK